MLSKLVPDHSGTGIYLWLGRMSLAAVMAIGVYMLLSGTEDGRLAWQLGTLTTSLPSPL